MPQCGEGPMAFVGMSGKWQCAVGVQGGAWEPLGNDEIMEV